MPRKKIKFNNVAGQNLILNAVQQHLTDNNGHRLTQTSKAIRRSQVSRNLLRKIADKKYKNLDNAETRLAWHQYHLGQQKTILNDIRWGKDDVNYLVDQGYLNAHTNQNVNRRITNVMHAHERQLARLQSEHNRIASRISNLEHQLFEIEESLE